MTRQRDRILFLLALVGLAITAVAMERWVPDNLNSLPTRAQVRELAALDAAELGYRVEGAPRIQVSAGPRVFAPIKPFDALVRDESSLARRRQRIGNAPPVRLAARYRTAVGSNGSTGDLVLEYSGEGSLVGASFGIDGLTMRGLPPPGGVYFADEIAEKLFRRSAPMRQETGLGSMKELVYQFGPDQPSVYVYLGNAGSWIAQLQPAVDLLVTRQSAPLWSRRPAQQVEIYGAVSMALLVVSVLLWRLGQRRAGFAQSVAPAVLLAVGLLPVFRSFEVNTSILVPLIALFIMPQLAVLLLWVVAEAEIREARPGAIQHWDRLSRGRPIRETGRRLLVGLAFGCILSGLISASGRIAYWIGGGYGSYLLNIPDYWLLPTPINRGIALAAGTAFLVGLGGRLAGRPGAMLGAGAAGLGWSVLMPVSPIVPAWVLGISASMAAGWTVWWHGLLPMTVACVTGLSIPVAWIAWSFFPLMIPTALAASLPVLLLPLGLLLLWRAPAYSAVEQVEPRYVANLENEARLRAEVEVLRDLQLSLLPDEEDGVRPAGVDISWRMVPAEAVGGDFLDLIQDDDGRLWIAVADVAGHGISCSLLTAYTKAAVTEHAIAGIGPKQALAGIRRLFRKLRGRRSLVTLLLAVWDPRERTLRVASAGHPPAMLCDRGRVQEVGGPGRPLGVELPGEDEEQVADCGEGSVLVVYTDGVGEALSASDEVFGYDRWQEMLPALSEASSDEILGSLLAAVDEHRAGRPAMDDTTAIVLKLTSSEK